MSVLQQLHRYRVLLCQSAPSLDESIQCETLAHYLANLPPATVAQLTGTLRFADKEVALRLVSLNGRELVCSDLALPARLPHASLRLRSKHSNRSLICQVRTMPGPRGTTRLVFVGVPVEIRWTRPMHDVATVVAVEEKLSAA